MHSNYTLRQHVPTQKAIFNIYPEELLGAFVTGTVMYFGEDFSGLSVVLVGSGIIAPGTKKCNCINNQRTFFSMP